MIQIKNSKFSSEIAERAYNTFDEEKAKSLAREFVVNQTWQCRR